MSAILYGNIFVFGIIVANIIKVFLRKAKLTSIIDDKLQKSIIGFLVDYLVLSSLMAINLSIIMTNIVPVIINIVTIGILTFLIVRFLPLISGDHAYERFMCEFEIVTGTAATWMLLLRSVDPQFETPVIQELAWWNVLQLVFGIHITFSQIGMPLSNFWLWYFLMIIIIMIFLILIILTFRKKIKY